MNNHLFDFIPVPFIEPIFIISDQNDSVSLLTQ